MYVYNGQGRLEKIQTEAYFFFRWLPLGLFWAFTTCHLRVKRRHVVSQLSGETARQLGNLGAPFLLLSLLYNPFLGILLLYKYSFVANRF